RRLGDSRASRAALEHALELAGGLGPVRQACVDHAVAHRDDAWLAALLESEAGLEPEAARAACLELDGALAHLRSGDVEKATKLLERGHGRAPTSRFVDARIAEELARLLEAAGKHEEVLRVRKAALRFISDPREEILIHRAVATAAERAGVLDDAVLALERARVLESDDPTILEELDRLLVSASRHEARAVLWMREAALLDDPIAKTRALLTAADAASAAGREGDAARHREAAWIAEPGAPGVFDALAERLAPPSSHDAVAARVALYEQAAQRTKDHGKRAYFLEKIAWLWDDVAGDAKRASRAYEDVLAIDGARRSAIAGLASAARRARDGKGLARALLAEAHVTEDAGARAVVRLRAAEALTDVEPERALAIAEELAGSDDEVASRARELVTRLHATAGRWDLVAQSLSARREAELRPASKVALALAEADVLARRAGAPERALATLDAAHEIAPDDPAVARAMIAALEAFADEARLRATLERLAAGARDAETRAARLLRAAELAERASEIDDAVRLYARAREALPDDRLVIERQRRLGARADVGSGVVPPLLAACRALESGRDLDASTVETLLAGGARDLPTLRLAERLARRARSAPQLANALALQAETTTGTLALRALSSLATLVAWTLPESDELGPWDRLLALGSRDAVVLDELVKRAGPKLRAGDERALDLAILATRQRLRAVADDTERLALELQLARLLRRSGALREAADACREVLAIAPTSVGAAIVLASVATDLGDRRAAVAAASALAEVARDPRARAALLRDAADLSAAQGDTKNAAVLLERALEADPEAVVIAARLAQIQGGEGAWADLARALRRGLSRAKSAEAVVPMAAELADVAKNRLKDPLLAIEALTRSREVSPGHVPALFLLAELYIGQRTWNEALEALGEVVRRSTEREEKLIALAGRASILARVLDRPEDAEAELRAALQLDPHDVKALRSLADLPVAITHEERADLLSRLVVADTRPAERLATLLELAQIRREIGDAAGAEGALVEAAALSPDPAMLERLRAAAGGDAETTARVLGRAVARAREAGATPGASWLAGLGEIELGLGRVDQAIEHFEEALRLEPFREPARLALARALSAKGRHETAAAALAPLLEKGTVVDAAFVRLLDEALTGAGRVQQAQVARELRALAGELDEAGLASLRARRAMGLADGAGEALSRSALRSFVMPGGLGKHPIWESAAVGLGLAGKLARVGLAEQGASTKDRVKPKAVHPVRPLFDRVVRAFELSDIELAVSEHAVMPVVACDDGVWVVVPSSLADWPEPHAIAALARPLARIALGVPWFGALPAAESLAIVVAFARLVAPSLSATPHEALEPLISDCEARARRALDRRRRKALEELEPSLSRAPALPLDVFADALLRTEVRAAFLLSGDLRASLDAFAASDGALGDALRVPGKGALAAVLSRDVARDLVSFALGGDATALRRSLGTLWS
ncbi:MAG: tetratricopeptide repeat protein, partial [Labilithrix sp.]|nr:tetratricopeptide repeat protein [Labilithrix sp.]